MTFDEIPINRFIQIKFDTIIRWQKIWHIVHGGRVKLDIMDYADGTVLKTFNFSIKGINPSFLEVATYVENEQLFDEFWFLKKLLVHESGSHAINAYSEMEQFNPYTRNKEKLWTTWDHWSRCPNRSFDNGWGLGQITNPAPEKQSLWDWKFNIFNSYDILLSKKIEVQNRLNGWVNYINNWQNSNPDSSIIDGHDLFIHGGITWAHSKEGIYSLNDQWETVFPNDLEENQRSFLDANVLKAYNGLGSETNNRDFYYLQTFPVDPQTNIQPRPEWRIDIDAHYGSGINYYVRAVSSTSLPNIGEQLSD